MKKIPFKLPLLVVAFAMLSTLSYAQDSEPKPIKNLKVFNADQQQNLSSVNELFTQELKYASGNAFNQVSQERDNLGFVHTKYQQYFNGIKVEFGTVKLHSKNGKVSSMSSEFYDIQGISVSPGLSASAAFSRATAHMGAKAYLWEDEAASLELGYQRPTGELVLLPIFDSQEEVKLAYKFEIYTIRPMGGGDIYIDAQTGKTLFFNNKVRHFDNFGHDGRALATVTADELPTCEEVVAELEDFVAGSAATRYSGTRTIETTLSGGSYTLNDASRKVYTRDANNLAPVGSSLPYISSYSEFTDNDNNWTAAEYNNSNKDNAALDAHWGAMMTYDYWQTVHNRDSYNNAGAQLRSYVHVDNNYDNAFWFLNVMSYGDGSSNGNEGNGYFDALTSLDVAAHEIGHAVTEYTANLAYQRESGGLNEGFSDIWGAAVEHFAKGNGSDSNPDNSIWLIGDEIDRRSGSAALRSMDNPTSLGQPDTYGGSYWINPNCGTPTSSNDYCGVHTNSGVLNYWFYLAVEGGSGTNDVGNAFSVSGVGMTKSATISYRMLNVYLTANSTFADARAASIQSAIDLYGADGAEEIAVTNAWHAVGVGDAYGGTTPPADCVTGDLYLSITLDNYPEETAWTLKDGSGTTVASASYSTANADGSTVTDTFSGLAAGDYTFTITDAYGDGICCSYGNGSYTVSSDAGVMFTGGNFGSSEATSFCVEDDGGPGPDTEAPTTPTGLAASAITETTATLSWNASTDNTGVTGYEVLQGSTSIGTVTGTSANITGLTENTSYTFSVRAYDAAGNNSAAASVAFTTNAAGGGGGGSPVVLHQGSFESGWDGWSDGGSDSYRYSGSRSFQGNYSIRLRDNTNSSTMTLGSFDVSGYNTLDIEFYFYAWSMENNEDFWVQFYNGSSWVTVGSYARGTNFNNNTFYSATVSINSADYNFPTNAQFRFRCDASGNSDHVYIDQVTITADAAGSSLGSSITSMGVPAGFADLGDQEEDFEGDFLMYPNPVSNTLNVRLIGATGSETYRVVNLLGQVVAQGTLTQTIDVSRLQSGVYVLEINEGEEIVTERFIKQ